MNNTEAIKIEPWNQSVLISKKFDKINIIRRHDFVLSGDLTNLRASWAWASWPLGELTVIRYCCCMNFLWKIINRLNPLLRILAVLTYLSKPRVTSAYPTASVHENSSSFCTCNIPIDPDSVEFMPVWRSRILFETNKQTKNNTNELKKCCLFKKFDALFVVFFFSRLSARSIEIRLLSFFVMWRVTDLFIVRLVDGTGACRQRDIFVLRRFLLFYFSEE